MKLSFFTLIIFCGLFFLSETTQAQSLTWLGTLGGIWSRAEGVSNDGLVVVGFSLNATGYQRRAFIWTPSDGMHDLGTLGSCCSGAIDVSADGSSIVGWAIDDTIHVRAFLWTSTVGMTDLGTFPNGHESGAYGISSNGSVVVGESWNGDGQILAFRWENGFMQSLGALGGDYSRAYAASEDGSVIVGEVTISSNESHAFRWTSSGGMQDLGTLGGKHSYAYSVSNDGSVVVGGSTITGGLGIHVFRWTELGGMKDLGTLGGVLGIAHDVSGDGSIIVGISDLANSEQYAFIWRADSGMQDLNVLYDSLIEPDSYLKWAQAVSENGRYIVGAGFNATTRRREGFLLDTGISTGIEEEILTNNTYQLFQNYPNPFNPTTTINYLLKEPGFVSLKVYDILGKEIAVLVNKTKTAGYYKVIFNASNLPSGLYIYRMTVNNFKLSKKMFLIK